MCNTSLRFQQIANLWLGHRRHAPRLFLGRQNLLQLVLRYRSDGNQHLTEARCLRQILYRSGQFLTGRFWLDHIEFAIVHDETEGAFDVIPARRRFQLHHKTEIATLRVDVDQRWYEVHSATHRDHTPHVAQIAGNRQRIHTVAKGLRTKTRGYMPNSQAFNTHRGGRGMHFLCGRTSIPRFRQGAQLHHQISTQVPLFGRIGAFIRSGIYQKLDLIVALEQQGADVRRQRQFSIAHLVEQGFHVVGEVDHPTQTKNAGGALDRMGATEQGVQQLAVVWLLLQLQQQRLYRLNLLGSLADEGGHCGPDEFLIRVDVLAHGNTVPFPAAGRQVSSQRERPMVRQASANTSLASTNCQDRSILDSAASNCSPAPSTLSTSLADISRCSRTLAACAVDQASNASRISIAL